MEMESNISSILIKKSMSMMKERILWIDELKGFTIFLVIIGHILISRFLPQFQLFHTVIYSFHMPLFMFLSGIFSYKALEAVDNQCKKSIWERKYCSYWFLAFRGYCCVFIIMKISSVNFYLKVVPTTGIY